MFALTSLIWITNVQIKIRFALGLSLLWLGSLGRHATHERDSTAQHNMSSVFAYQSPDCCTLLKSEIAVQCALKHLQASLAFCCWYHTWLLFVKAVSCFLHRTLNVHNGSPYYEKSYWSPLQPNKHFVGGFFWQWTALHQRKLTFSRFPTSSYQTCCRVTLRGKK